MIITREMLVARGASEEHLRLFDFCTCLPETSSVDLSTLLWLVEGYHDAGFHDWLYDEFMEESWAQTPAAPQTPHVPEVLI